MAIDCGNLDTFIDSGLGAGILHRKEYGLKLYGILDRELLEDIGVNALKTHRRTNGVALIQIVSQDCSIVIDFLIQADLSRNLATEAEYNRSRGWALDGCNSFSFSQTLQASVLSRWKS